MNKKKIKHVVDMLMFCDFVFLMCQESMHNLTVHGSFGIALFVLFVVHHLLNIGFYKSMNQGVYTPLRRINTLTTWLLFVFMIAMAVSGVLMSSEAFSFSKVPMYSWSRQAHNFACSWGYLIMGFHLGLHHHGMIDKAIASGSKKKDAAIIAMCILLIAVGLFVIIRFKFYVYLLWLPMWKNSICNVALCVLQYLAIHNGSMSVSLLVYRLTKLNEKKSSALRPAGESQF